MWMDPITEVVNQSDTETWEIYDFTMDAHPIHIHQVQFQVINREVFTDMFGGTIGTVTPPESWESGFKDTVIVYPGELTRVKARFDLPGLFVWHCHILEHEDNEMMRPYRVHECSSPDKPRYNPHTPTDYDGRNNGILHRLCDEPEQWHADVRT